jgi:hypothetical protein
MPPPLSAMVNDLGTGRTGTNDRNTWFWIDQRGVEEGSIGDALSVGCGSPDLQISVS